MLSRLLLLGAIMALFLGVTTVSHAQSTAPTVTAVAITSSPGTDNTYATGDTITVGVTFSEAVTVVKTDRISYVSGIPYVRLIIGGRAVYADYSGDGSSAVVQPFSYTVEPLDRDADGVSLRANSVRLDGGTIQATDDSANAILTHSAMAFAGHKVAAGGRVRVGLGQVGIELSVDLNDGDRSILDEGMRSTSNEAWQWQRSATEAGPYSDIPASEGGTSIPYTPSADDLGKWLKVTVTYDDTNGTGWTGEATTQVLPQPTLSNASYTYWNLIAFANNSGVPHPYAQGFTTGSDTRGYLLTEVRLALYLGGDSVTGTWAVHANDAGKPAAEPISAALPILGADLDDEIDTFEQFTHPHGVHLEPDTNYWLVISQTTPVEDGFIGVGLLTDWNGSLGEGEYESRFEGYTTSQVVEAYPTPLVDPGSEEGWSLDPGALAYLGNEPDTNLPELLPWRLLATSLMLPEMARFVLRMSLVVAPEVTVEFTHGSYTVAEGGTETVTVKLSADPERTLVIPITTTGEGGASSSDYSTSSSVTFIAGETSKTFDFTATQDTLDDDDESVKLGFGTLPDAWVSAGTRDETTVSITDDDDPLVTVQFGQASQLLEEGETVNVTVTLSADPERTVTIPMAATGQNGASSADYSVPSSVTFNDGETEKTIAFMAVEDDEDDDDESVKLGFGSALPARVSVGTRTETTLNIGDNDNPIVTVMFAQSTHTVDEGGTQQVTVSVNADPERTLIIPIEAAGQDGATAADYSGVPPSVTFNSGETSKTFDFEATQDEIDDDNESVNLSFGTMPDARVTTGTTDELTLSITDDDTAALVVTDESLTVGEGESSSYTVKLATEPTDSVTVAITGHAGTALTLSGVTLTSDALTFTAANWNTAQTVTVTADHDDNSINEDVTLTHTATGGGYTALTDELSVSVTDDDTPAIVLTPVGLTVGESDTASYTVRLATEPTAGVTVAISGHAGTDLSLSGATLTNDALTFTTTNWDTAQTVTVAAAHDADSANDTATLTHTGGGGEYAGVNSRLPVVVTDDDTGALRLVGGVLTDEQGRLCEGRLEIYYNGAWGTICDDYWNKNNADVACRALGFAASVEDYNRFRTAYFGPGSADQAIVLDDLLCTGNESGLLECRSGHPQPGISNCRHSEDVSLRCLKHLPTRIMHIAFNAPPGGNGSYDVGETVEVTLVWNEAVTVSTPEPGWVPAVWVSYAGAHFERALYSRGSGTNRTVFTHTFEDFGGATSFSFVGVSADTLHERDGSIRSVETGLQADLHHGSYRSAQTGDQAEAASIVGAPAFSDPGSDNAWSTGEALEVTFAFSQSVQVDTTGGTPSLPVLLSGAASRQALYLRGSGTTQLVFAYTLTDTDGTHSSLLLAPNSLALNGGSIQDVDHMLDASIEHLGAGAMYARLDVAAPELQSAGVDGATLTLTYNEELDTGATPPASAFAVNVNGAARTIMGAGLGQSSVLLFLSPAVESGDTVTVDYTVPTDESANKVQDASGNAAESFSGQVVTNNTVPADAGNSVAAEPPGSPNSLNMARHESGKLLASWNAPDSGSTPAGYTLQWKQSGDDWAAPDKVSETDVTGTSHVITGLTDGVEYAVRVIAYKDDAVSGPSGEVAATPQETVPPSPSSASVDGATLTITFDEPLNPGETPDKSAFSVTVGDTARDVDAVAVSGSAATITLVTGVCAGDTVTVDYTAPTDGSAARLRDVVGNVAASFSGRQATNATQAADQPTACAPGVPAGLEVVRGESGQLLASWNAPDSGLTPTGYTLQWKQSGEDWADPDKVSETDVTGTSHLITGLTDGVEYAVRVFAYKDDAVGAPSGEVAATPQETVPPSPSSASVDGATLTITFDEPLNPGETPDKSAFSVTVGDTARYVDAVAVSGSAVTVTLVTAVFAGDTVTVDYTAPTDESAARLRDEVGNVAASFSGRQATNATQAADQLTASVHGVPAAHDGNTTFTFELRFSETPRKRFSYKIMRDLAFTVTGGEVVKARRLEKGKNVRWEIHVTPDSSGGVTIVLPATTDCTVEGAICTQDRRPLSNQLEVTVPGPDGQALAGNTKRPHTWPDR